MRAVGGAPSLRGASVGPGVRRDDGRRCWGGLGWAELGWAELGWAELGWAELS